MPKKSTRRKSRSAKALRRRSRSKRRYRAAALIAALEGLSPGIKDEMKTELCPDEKMIKQEQKYITTAEHYKHFRTQYTIDQTFAKTLQQLLDSLYNHKSIFTLRGDYGLHIDTVTVTYDPKTKVVSFEASDGNIICDPIPWFELKRLNPDL